MTDSITITNTKAITIPNVKILVHAPSGAGKTRLCATAPTKPLIISAEAGLLSLRGYDLDVVEVTDINAMRNIHTFLTTDSKYGWVCIDSITEIAEKILTREKSATKDGRMAYGKTNNIVIEMVKAYRDLPKNVYMCAKQESVKDEVIGGFFFGASAPGKTIGPALPYLFDEVFALHAWKDTEGVVQRGFQTGRDNQYEAKDRSGALAFAEPADLAHIYNKITSTINNQ